MKRRERTHQLIELGGLISKAALIELTDDDRAVIYGALIDLAGRLNGPDRDAQLALGDDAGSVRSKTPDRARRTGLATTGAECRGKSVS